MTNLGSRLLTDNVSGENLDNINLPTSYEILKLRSYHYVLSDILLLLITTPSFIIMTVSSSAPNLVSAETGMNSGVGSIVNTASQAINAIRPELGMPHTSRRQNTAVSILGYLPSEPGNIVLSGGWADSSLVAEIDSLATSYPVGLWAAEARRGVGEVESSGYRQMILLSSRSGVIMIYSVTTGEVQKLSKLKGDTIRYYHDLPERVRRSGMVPYHVEGCLVARLTFDTPNAKPAVARSSAGGISWIGKSSRMNRDMIRHPWKLNDEEEEEKLDSRAPLDWSLFSSLYHLEEFRDSEVSLLWRGSPRPASASPLERFSMSPTHPVRSLVTLEHAWGVLTEDGVFMYSWLTGQASTVVTSSSNPSVVFWKPQSANSLITPVRVPLLLKPRNLSNQFSTDHLNDLIIRVAQPVKNCPVPYIYWLDSESILVRLDAGYEAHKVYSRWLTLREYSRSLNSTQSMTSYLEVLTHASEDDQNTVQFRLGCYLALISVQTLVYCVEPLSLEPKPSPYVTRRYPHLFDPVGERSLSQVLMEYVELLTHPGRPNGATFHSLLEPSISISGFCHQSAREEVGDDEGDRYRTLLIMSLSIRVILLRQLRVFLWCEWVRESLKHVDKVEAQTTGRLGRKLQNHEGNSGRHQVVSYAERQRHDIIQFLSGIGSPRLTSQSIEDDFLPILSRKRPVLYRSFVSGDDLEMHVLEDSLSSTVNSPFGSVSPWGSSTIELLELAAIHSLAPSMNHDLKRLIVDITRESLSEVDELSGLRWSSIWLSLSASMDEDRQYSASWFECIFRRVLQLHSTGRILESPLIYLLTDGLSANDMLNDLMDLDLTTVHLPDLKESKITRLTLILFKAVVSLQNRFLQGRENQDQNVIIKEVRRIMAKPELLARLFIIAPDATAKMILHRANLMSTGAQLFNNCIDFIDCVHQNVSKRKFSKDEMKDVMGILSQLHLIIRHLQDKILRELSVLRDPWTQGDFSLTGVKSASRADSVKDSHVPRPMKRTIFTTDKLVSAARVVVDQVSIISPVTDSATDTQLSLQEAKGLCLFFSQREISNIHLIHRWSGQSANKSRPLGLLSENELWVIECEDYDLFQSFERMLITMNLLRCRQSFRIGVASIMSSIRAKFVGLDEYFYMYISLISSSITERTCRPIPPAGQCKLIDWQHYVAVSIDFLFKLPHECVSKQFTSEWLKEIVHLLGVIILGTHVTKADSLLATQEDQSMRLLVYISIAIVTGGSAGDQWSKGGYREWLRDDGIGKCITRGLDVQELPVINYESLTLSHVTSFEALSIVSGFVILCFTSCPSKWHPYPPESLITFLLSPLTSHSSSHQTRPLKKHLYDDTMFQSVLQISSDILGEPIPDHSSIDPNIETISARIDLSISDYHQQQVIASEVRSAQIRRILTLDESDEEFDDSIPCDDLTFKDFCAICLAEIKPFSPEERIIRIQQCQHQFHESCLTEMKINHSKLEGKQQHCDLKSPESIASIQIRLNQCYSQLLGVMNSAKNANLRKEDIEPQAEEPVAMTLSDVNYLRSKIRRLEFCAFNLITDYCVVCEVYHSSKDLVNQTNNGRWFHVSAADTGKDFKDIDLRNTDIFRENLMRPSRVVNGNGS
eukprot:GHVH01006554.1.p1 GENE.GHVH01006554.1~~GHVH01006554.1.p1  ORF type:complete len:1608 (+),score=232.33 GHVH01006554.1:1363-6186(+)